MLWGEPRMTALAAAQLEFAVPSPESADIVAKKIEAILRDQKRRQRARNKSAGRSELAPGWGAEVEQCIRGFARLTEPERQCIVGLRRLRRLSRKQVAVLRGIAARVQAEGRWA
jgi:hypothetical protein